MMRLLPAVLVLSGALLVGCKSVPLSSDPMDSGVTRPAGQLFKVEWWKQLVHEQALLQTGPREVAQPAYDSERQQVIALTRDGVVHALGVDGKPRWTYRTGAFFSAGATIHDGKVLVPGGNGTLYALDAAKGTPVWTYDTGEELATSPLVADGKVLVASHNDALFAVDAASGKWLWQYRRESPSGFTIRGVSTPVAGDGLVYLGFADGVVSALELSDGTPRWERVVSSPGGTFRDVDTSPILAGGRLYVASYKDGVFALDPATGRVVWNTPARGLTDLLARGDVLYAAGDGQVAAFLAENGKQVWSLPLPKQAGRRLSFAKGYLLVPVQESLLFVDPGSGRKVLQWDPGQGVSAAALPAAGRLFVLSNNGYLYSLDLAGARG
ncbi:MAG: PQQ-binding-like beta-propeller repeat protein [Myxococcaceae bacterium]|nr:PQQ-binding-like beta-propeller repeat protein [Myxococcaceae bacterium]MCI0671777.1 PQQ-binding-like beta-propeller repeat protein [Myxococcaceae bacterium]